MVLKELIIFALFSFTFSVILVTYGYVNSVVTADMQATLDNERVTTWFTSMGEVWGWLDYALIFSYFTYVAGSVILAFFTRSHPAFLIPYMLGLFVVTFVSWIYQNTFDEVIGSISGFQAIYDAFPQTKFFMTNLHYLTLIAGSIIAVVQYSQSPNRNSYPLFGNY